MRLYYFGIFLAALFGKDKAKKWLNGRKKWAKKLTKIDFQNRELIWFHVASLGEFEQARPIIESLKKNAPDKFILLSFFSPSGYEIRKNYKFADHVCYLPLDTKKNAIQFLQIINPKVIVFIKYEFWFNYLDAIYQIKTKCYLVSGIFRTEQHFFKAYGTWFKKHLRAFDHFYLQNKESKELLSKIGFDNSTINGDSRLDQVISISKEHFNDFRFESFSKNSKIIAFGSSWERENILAQKLHKTQNGLKLIIAPHEIIPTQINSLKNKFSNCTVLSETKHNQNLSSTEVLIVDQIGLLSKLYRFADFAVIGGGFGAGIHNTLEAVVYGCPVIFGPNFKKFQEASDLIKTQAAFSVKTDIDFLKVTDKLLQNNTFYQKSKINALEYVNTNSGASQVVINKLLNPQT